MEVYAILFVTLFAIFLAAICYLILKENVEVKNLRKNFTTMSIEDIKNLILKLSKDGIFINEDIFNKINTHGYKKGNNNKRSVSKVKDQKQHFFILCIYGLGFSKVKFKV